MARTPVDRCSFWYNVLSIQGSISFRTLPRGGNPSKARIVWEATRHCLRLLGLTRVQVRYEFERYKTLSSNKIRVGIEYV